MVARPTDIPEWASDANYPAGSEAWSGTPTRVEPDPDQLGTGNVPEERPPAQHHNWITGLLADWIAYFAAIIDADEEHTYQAPKPRETTLSLLGRVPAVPMDAGQTPDDADVTWFTSESTGVRSNSNEARILIPLDFLPDGAVVTAVRLLVDPGVARATVANRMRLDVHRQDVTWGSATIGGTVALGNETNGHAVDDGTTNQQEIIIDAFDETLTISKATGRLHYIFVQAGNDAGSNRDDVLALRVDWTDPGPRNA